MPEESRADVVEKFLADQKAFEDRKQALIDDLLKQKEAAMKEFDEKLAKLGFRTNSSGKPKKSHHKQAQDSAETRAKTQGKPKV